MKMGKMEEPAIRLVSSLPASPSADEILILCPFLAGLEPALGMWLGPLAWHDCNAALIAALAGRTVPAQATVFAGVFCTDPFRPDDDVIAVLLDAGVAGVVNLPSVSFLDGDFGRTLAAMNLGVARELSFLRRARSRGLRVMGCAGAVADADALLAAGAEAIILHAEPPVSSRIGRGKARDRLAVRREHAGVRLIDLSTLLSSDASA